MTEGICKAGRARRRGDLPARRMRWATVPVAHPTLRDQGRLREPLPEFARGVDAEDAQVVGEEGEFLQRELQRAVVGVAFDVGVELGGGEGAVELVALQLGHVDAVGGEAAHRLVERGRHVAHAEDEGGDDRARCRPARGPPSSTGR